MDISIGQVGSGFTMSDVGTGQVEASILDVIEKEGPLHPREIVRLLSQNLGSSEEQVRNVIWKLLDGGRLDPDARFRLTVSTRRRRA